MKMILAMSPTILLVVYGQLITKWRISVLAERLEDVDGSIVRLFEYIKDPYIASSYIAALLGSAAWMFVVERYAISIAFPIYVGLTVLAVAIGGCLLFSEAITPMRGLAIALIVAGVAIGSRS